MSLLEVEDLHAGYGPVAVLRGISFSVEEGQTVALLGANGAGKTTTLRAVCGMLKAKGRVAFDGTDIAGRSPSGSCASGSPTCPRGAGRSRR